MIKSRRKLVVAMILIIIVFIYSTFQEKVEDYEYYIANSINIVATDYVENLKTLAQLPCKIHKKQSFYCFQAM